MFGGAKSFLPRGYFMVTSTVVYLPVGPRKAVDAAIRDAHHQLELRAERKRPGCRFDATWSSCRCDPGVWRLSVEVRMAVIMGVKDGELIREAKDWYIEWIPLSFCD